jgi:hypothetical protein
MNNSYYAKQINDIVAEVKKAVIGKDTIVIKTLLAILCKGHILIEDIPGVGKTTLALAFSKALSLEHNRMQFTPDVLPSDVTGFSVYNKVKNTFEFRPGVAFCNLFLGRWSREAAVSLSPYAVPLGAAVYGILTPFIEEIVFRGIVWHRLRRGFAPLASAFFSSLLFAAAHENIPQAIYGFIMGMIFALSYELTLRFEIPFLLHCKCNLCVLAASAAGWGRILSGPLWLVFFAVGSLAAFGYWAVRLRETKFKL